MTKCLLEFPDELWNRWKKKLRPFGDTHEIVLENLIKIFLGDLAEANPDVVNELRRVLAQR